MPGGQQVLVPAVTEKAQRLVTVFRFCNYLLLILALFTFLAQALYDGFFCLFGGLIGWMAIRNQQGVAIQQVVCYFFFTVLTAFTTIFRMIMYFSGTDDSADKLSSWAHAFYVGTCVAGPVIYTICAYVSYQLYNALKQLVEEQMRNDFMGAGGQAPGYAPQQQQPHPQQDTRYAQGPGYAQMRENTAAPTPGFKPFSGTGHRLGTS
jgi:hypothetical protein